MNEGPEENLRLIKLLIGSITRLEYRVNAIVDCLDSIEQTSSKLSSIFGVLTDNLRDEGYPQGFESKTTVELVEEAYKTIQDADRPWIKYYSQHDEVYWGKKRAIEIAKEKFEKVRLSASTMIKEDE